MKRSVAFELIRYTPILAAVAPATTARGRPGSSLGGTGIATRGRCQASPGLLDHLRLLMRPATIQSNIEATVRCNRGDNVRLAIVTGTGEKSFCAKSGIRGLDTYP